MKKLLVAIPARMTNSVALNLRVDERHAQKQ